MVKITNKLTEVKKINIRQWNQETVDRYVRVGHRLQTMPKTSSALDLYEGHMGRASLLDGVTSLRSWVSSLPAV